MRIADKLKIAAHSVAFGLKGADEVITQQANFGSNEGSNIIQEKQYGGVFADMLQQKETQEVKEMRDSYYRVFREADKYHVDVSGSIDPETGDFSGETITGKTRKKVATDFNRRVEILNEENYEIRVIQDVKLISLESNWAPMLDVSEEEKMVPNINIERDGFTPRFKIEKYANKFVARKKEDNKYIVDFYTTMYASQFGKVDALYIAELNKIYADNHIKTDTTDFISIEFVTDKAFGCEDMLCFKFENIVFKSISIYDGNFVLSFECDCTSDGIDIVEQYKTKEMDEKYATKAAKKNPDINAIQRRMDEDFETTTLKLS